MSPALVFVVPAAVSLVLTLVTGLAYRHARRGYLRWWAIVWAVAFLYYLTVFAAALAGPSGGDVFARLGVVGSVLGWARVVGFWSGARILAERPIGLPLWGAVAVASLAWAWLVSVPLAGQPYTAALTRMAFACWFFLGAAELLLPRPRSTINLFCGLMLLLMGIQGFVAARVVLDVFGSMMSGWVHTALSMALGLGVYGRMLYEEREAARARSAELAGANARLAELDQLKSEFVSMVSHELRTPLGLIKGYVGTLLRPDMAVDEPTRREFLQVIDEETDRLTELVANLLDMSRIEAGTLRVEPRPTELAPLLMECTTRLHAREPDRALRLDVPADLPPVLADDRRIIQVVDNLLTNAASYTPPDAPIALEARAVDGRVEVAVADGGPGIPPDKRELVFEKFVRLPGERGPRVGGTGLGLAICRGIVQAHGGRIWVESDGGSGSTFAFSLPTAGEAR
jgi:signal transduction histidine kinase